MLGQPSALALAFYAMGMVLVETDADRGRLYSAQSIAMTEQGASDVVFANALGTLAFDLGAAPVTFTRLSMPCAVRSRGPTRSGTVRR